MNADGTRQKPLTRSSATDASPAWSPKDLIAFQSDVAGNMDIYVMSADGGSAEQLTFNSVDEGSPAWSPDGTRIVFVRDTGPDWEKWIMSADGGKAEQLTFSPRASDKAPSWAPAELIASRPIAAGTGTSGSWRATAATRTR